jgi:metal-responsive CopG/Arc/MetJ family transcriptional regulator
MPETKNDRSVLIRLPATLLAKIDQYRHNPAGEIVRSRSTVVRMAIMEYLENRIGRAK